MFYSIKAIFIFITADFVWEQTLYSFKKLFIFRNISWGYYSNLSLLFKPLRNKDLFIVVRLIPFVYRNLLRHLKRVFTASSTSLFINQDWLFFAIICFVGSNLFKSMRWIVQNNSNWFASALFSFSSLKSLLQKFLKSQCMFLRQRFLKVTF